MCVLQCVCVWLLQYLNTLARSVVWGTGDRSEERVQGNMASTNNHSDRMVSETQEEDYLVG